MSGRLDSLLLHVAAVVRDDRTGNSIRTILQYAIWWEHVQVVVLPTPFSTGILIVLMTKATLRTHAVRDSRPGGLQALEALLFQGPLCFYLSVVSLVSRLRSHL